jgi:thioredoxin reductase (NADPH)
MTEKAVRDVLIIGGGPAGISALLWCNELGMSATLIDRGSELGGQLLWINNEIRNYPGRIATNGRELRNHFLSNFDTLEQVRLNSEVVSFDASKISATLTDGTVLTARSAIIATGLRRRRLGIPGESRFAGRGILESGAGQRQLAKGKRVAIIGGGDAALENALILSEFAEKVFLIHRRDKFRARREFIEQVSQRKNVETLFDHKVTVINGDDDVRSISITHLPESSDDSEFTDHYVSKSLDETEDMSVSDSQIQTLNVDLVLIRIGFEPNTELFREQLDLDAYGYVLVDPTGQTSTANVFAVGDVTSRETPIIAGAVGVAAIAVKSLSG